MSTNTPPSVFDPDDKPPHPAVLAASLAAGILAAAIPVFAAIVLAMSRSPLLDNGLTAGIVTTLAGWFALAGGSFVALLTLTRPGRPPLARHLALAPAVFAVGVGVEMAQSPPATWLSRLAGKSPGGCFASVVLFSLPILASILFVLRAVPWSAPSKAGAVAGFLAGGVAAALYVWHCPEGSLLFIALWDGLAVLLVMSVGALLGRRYLRRAAFS